MIFMTIYWTTLEGEFIKEAPRSSQRFIGDHTFSIRKLNNLVHCTEAYIPACFQSATDGVPKVLRLSMCALFSGYGFSSHFIQAYLIDSLNMGWILENNMVYRYCDISMETYEKDEQIQSTDSKDY